MPGEINNVNAPIPQLNHTVEEAGLQTLKQEQEAVQLGGRTYARLQTKAEFKALNKEMVALLHSKQERLEALRDPNAGIGKRIGNWFKRRGTEIMTSLKMAGFGLEKLMLKAHEKISAKALDRAIREGNLDFEGLVQARAARYQLRQNLGAPMPNGILQKNVSFAPPYQNAKMSELMDTLHTDVLKKGETLSKEEMAMYINMGERIADAIKDTDPYPGVKPDGSPDFSLKVVGANGAENVIEPTIDNIRALSWYCQAKAVLDNQSPNRQPPLMDRGSFVMSDPGGKLLNFLRASPSSYGRISTHFAERAVGDKASSSGSGKFGLGYGQHLMGTLKGQKLQYGVEDFSNKMPSGGGCIAFGPLEGKDGAQQIMLKWESKGVPPTSKRHVDVADGPVLMALNKFDAFARGMRHAMNQVRGIFGKTHTQPGAAPNYRYDEKGGERFNTAVNRFKEAVNLAKSQGIISKDEAKLMLKDGPKHGLSRMEEGLAGIMDRLREMANIDPSEEKNLALAPAVNSLQASLDHISGFIDSMGERLPGIERKGEEIHLAL